MALSPGFDAAEPPTAPQKAQRRICCNSHCLSCGLHFASLAGFDLHRPGRTGHRKCVDPRTVMTDGKRRLIEKSTNGVCRISRADKDTGQPIEIQGVTVWQTVEASGA